jgi:hypothetical protein
METLDAILTKYVAQEEDTRDKLLGAAFVVVDSHSKLQPHLVPFPPPQLIIDLRNPV